MPLIPYHDGPGTPAMPPTLRVRVLCDWCGEEVEHQDGAPPVALSPGDGTEAKIFHALCSRAYEAEHQPHPRYWSHVYGVEVVASPPPP